MKKEILITAGQAAFGSAWQKDVAERLNISSRTIRFWLTGKCLPSIDLNDELKKMLQARNREIEAAIKLIERTEK